METRGTSYACKSFAVTATSAGARSVSLSALHSLRASGRRRKSRSPNSEGARRQRRSEQLGRYRRTQAEAGDRDGRMAPPGV